MGHRYEYNHKLVPRLRAAYTRGGLARIAKAPWRWLARLLSEAYILWFYRQFLNQRTFRFGDADLHYEYHAYNRTYRNERCVEVAIGRAFITSHSGKHILEVGNVLSHYFAHQGDILDKFETGNGIINQDIAEFQPATLYDLIISISTLEHVGWDEEVKDANKVLRVWERLISWLAPGGQLVVSVPLGYNPTLDQHLRSEAFLWSNITYLRRISPDNQWQEITPAESLGAQYNRPFHGANVVAIIQYNKGVS